MRVLRPTKLPTDDDVVAAMVDYYKEHFRTRDGERRSTPTPVPSSSSPASSAA